MARPLAHTQLNSSVPRQRHHPHAKRREHHPHRDIRHILRVRLAALELERAVVAREQAREADEHLAERRVHVEVELALEVVRAELAKVRLVPHDDVGGADFVEARVACEEGVDDGWEVFEILEREFFLRGVSGCVYRGSSRAHTSDVGGGSGGCGSRPLPRRAAAGRILLYTSFPSSS